MTKALTPDEAREQQGPAVAREIDGINSSIRSGLREFRVLLALADDVTAELESSGWHVVKSHASFGACILTISVPHVSLDRSLS